VILPEQLRAARAMLGWSRRVLAERTGSPEITIKLFELGKSDSRQTTVFRWQRVLEQEGIEFISETEFRGAGVRMRQPRSRMGVGKTERGKPTKKPPPPDLFDC